MIENRPLLEYFTHGVLIVAFPIYVTFVASTHNLEDVVQSPMPLLPGDQLIA
ncbi:MAG: glycerol-3-phosphate transporter, partial [Alphaproteobacteria bacterium]